MREKNKYGSLLWAIDKTTTSMGARLLRAWLCQPLKDIKQILRRQKVVKILVENSASRYDIETILRDIYDIQRLSTRMSNGSASPRDFVSLKSSLRVFPDLLSAAKDAGLDIFKNIEP